MLISTFGGEISVAVPHGILELVLHGWASQADRQQVLGLDAQAAGHVVLLHSYRLGSDASNFFRITKQTRPLKTKQAKSVWFLFGTLFLKFYILPSEISSHYLSSSFHLYIYLPIFKFYFMSKTYEPIIIKCSILLKVKILLIHDFNLTSNILDLNLIHGVH